MTDKIRERAGRVRERSGGRRLSEPEIVSLSGNVETQATPRRSDYQAMAEKKAVPGGEVK